MATRSAVLGRVGEQGPQGEQGIQGEPGAQGEQGPPGNDGTDGAAGPASLERAWSCPTPGASTNVRYLPAGLGKTAAVSATNDFEYVVAADCTYTKIYAHASAVGAGSGGHTYTILKNGSDTALAVSLDYLSLDNSATVAAVSFVAGDKIACKCQSNNSSATGNTRVTITIGP